MDNIILNRKEFKYYINYQDYKILSSTLSNVFSLDKNCSTDNKYHIRSLYLDNKSNSNYFEKMSGIEKRKKYRIRIYNLNKNIVKMEIKNKHNNFILKESLLISPEDAAKISMGDYICLLNYNHPLAEKLYGEFSKDHYRPVIIIDYLREAYHFGLNDLRITFDSSLKKEEVYLGDIFSRDLSPVPVLNNRKIIMEIKYNANLPLWIKNLLQLPRFERCAISKYTISRYME